MARSLRQQDDSQPRKAYLIRYKIVNVCEVVIHADSAADARARFAAGEGGDQPAWTGEDYRLGAPKVTRHPDEDR